MRILITNDDGIHAEGLLALKRALSEMAEVVVVAPDRPRSACGHSITLHKPLRVTEVRLPDGSPAYSTTGTPSDCVSLAVLDILRDRPPDVVVSGINSGPNLGWDLTYSGTVSAAMEGAILGIPSIAISVTGTRGPHNYDTAARFAVHLAESVREHGLEKWTLLNVNVPETEIRGVTITHQG